MTQTTRAVVMVKPGVVEMQRLPVPTIEPGGMLVRMHMAGICGTDKHAYQGESVLYGGTEAEQAIVFPGVRGHEVVGTIVEMDGTDRHDREYNGQELRVGDRITLCPNIICGNCWYCRNIFAYPFCARNTTVGLSFRSDTHPFIAGAWAELFYVPPRTWVYKVPDELPDELAVWAEIMVVTATLDRAKEHYQQAGRGFGFGDTVVIQGAGAVGVPHVFKARILGAGDIVAIDSSAEKLAMARQWGADHTLNIGETTAAERLAFIRDLTEGRGADVVVESVGTAEVVREGLEMLRRGGTYVETGNFVDAGEVSLNVHRHLSAKNVLLIGNTNHPHSGYYRAMKVMQKWAKCFPLHSFVTHRFRLEEASTAMEKSFAPDALKVAFVP